MAAKTNRREGDSFAWFCDPPEILNNSKKSKVVVTTSAPISQIPFTEYNDDDDNLKDFPTAKTGVRSDLLTYEEPKGSMEPVKYTSNVDWYMHQEHQKTKEKTELPLPEYMMHKEFSPHDIINEAKPFVSQASPYPLDDNLSYFQREGKRATDKTIPLTQPKHRSKRTKEKILEFQARELTRNVRPVRNVIWTGESL